ncbi:MAG: hypothetical protein KTQ49_04790 [Candidatus Omnitrophica bacterium]|nr:hypothetical protein [Candidatus Omnitrophota bacterium]
MRKKDMIELGITVMLGVVLLMASVPLIQRARTPPGSQRGSVPKNVPEGITARQTPRHSLQRKPVDGEKFINRFRMVTEALPLERDPFALGGQESRDIRTVLPLNGILWDEASPMAVVGPDLLKEGDVTGRFKVVKIHPTKVVFQDGSSQFEVLWDQKE